MRIEIRNSPEAIQAISRLFKDQAIVGKIQTQSENLEAVQTEDGKWHLINEIPGIHKIVKTLQPALMGQ